MPNYEILGITVRFPYKAYDCQIKLMESVIASLKGGSNALIESPTGLQITQLNKRNRQDSLLTLLSIGLAGSSGG